jgi:hypothetical protein
MHCPNVEVLPRATVVLLLKTKGLVAFSGCSTRGRAKGSAAATKVGVHPIALHAALMAPVV